MKKAKVYEKVDEVTNVGNDKPVLMLTGEDWRRKENMTDE